MREVYLAPALKELQLSGYLKSPNAPWAESLVAAPEETARVVQQGLTAIMRATPSLDPEAINVELLPDGRARRHLTALRALWRELDALPDQFAVLAHVLGSKAEDALEALPLLDPAPCPFADPIEIAVLDKLNAHHGSALGEARAAWLARQPSRTRASAGALGHVQEYLGKPSSATIPDETLTLVGLRDLREEADYAAAQVQRMLDDGTVGAPSEVGVLVPDDVTYQSALQDAFDRVGLPLSGLPDEPDSRDVVGDLLLALVAVFEGPGVPRTALASLYANSFMPWPRDTGRRMARELMDRGYSRTAKELDEDKRQLVDNFRPVKSPEELVTRLFAIAESIPKLSLASRIGELRAIIGKTLDWPALRTAAAPRPTLASGTNRFVEGVSLFTETALPWRSVRQLITLGLCGPHWPKPASANPLFTESEIDLIRDKAGFALNGRSHSLGRGLELFRRQLCAATEGVTMLLPARDLHGDQLAPSTGLALISHMLGARAPNDLLCDIRSQPAESWNVAHDVVAPLPTVGEPDIPQDGFLELTHDLLRLRRRDDGAAASQSPSRLETLLVSPFAWLLDELGAKNRIWLPEALDVLLLGTLMHHVLEKVFPADATVPTPKTVAQRVPLALEEGIQRYATWLKEPGWAAERANLLREANEIAQAWERILVKAGAEILRNEIDLEGHNDGLLIAGRADTVLRLPDQRILVVDFKRARSAARRDRMAKSWDLQVALYRAMLEHPTVETPVSRLVADGSAPITAYYTMLDNTLLIDEANASVPGGEPAGSDISSAAMAHLDHVLKEIRGGTVRLNGVGDSKRFEKERSTKAYALQDNELVQAFLAPEPEEGEND